MDIVRLAASANYLTLRDLGRLLGDVDHPAGGDRAAELLAAARAGDLPTHDGRASLYARVTRDQFAAWLHRFGRPTDQRGLAWSWAHTSAIPDVAGMQPFHFRASAQRCEGLRFDGTTKSRTFSGVAYAGGLVTDHAAYRAGVAFDLATTTFETPAPLLFDHREPVGVIRRASLSARIEIEGEIFADVEPAARKVTAMADRGMPWQLSVGIWPDRVEDVAKGTRVQLNGRSFDGPLTVFRGNRVREVSLVTLGADDKTRASIK